MMKQIFLILIIFLVKTSTIFCQVTNILPLNQKIEIVKGLQQGNNLKETVLKLQEALTQSKLIIKKDSLLIVNKNKIIALLEKTNDINDQRLKLKTSEHNINNALLKDKLKKRISLGISIGTSIKNFKTLTLETYIGLGINYRIIRF